MSTENIEVATKAKPFLRKTKFILEKNQKIKILGGFVKNGMAWMARKKNIIFIGWNGLVLLLFMVYIFFICWPRGGEKKRVYRKHKAIF